MLIKSQSEVCLHTGCSVLQSIYQTVLFDFECRSKTITQTLTTVTLPHLHLFTVPVNVNTLSSLLHSSTSDLQGKGYLSYISHKQDQTNSSFLYPAQQRKPSSHMMLPLVYCARLGKTTYCNWHGLQDNRCQSCMIHVPHNTFQVYDDNLLCGRGRWGHHTSMFRVVVTNYN